MTYCSIIFDLDGTLIDSAQLTGAIIDAMLAERGAEELADRAAIKAMDAVGGEAMIAAVMGRHTADPAADLEEFRRRHFELDVPGDVLFADVAEVLAALDAMSVKLAICSNKPQYLCEKILKDLGVDHRFAAIFGSTPDRPRKPDPAAAFLALTALEANPRETLFCGDSAIDVATAKAAGLDACLVGWGYGTAYAHQIHPELPVVGDMAELLAVVHGGEG